MIKSLRFRSKPTKAPLHYPECGLPDVYLISGYRWTKDPEGDDLLVVEDVDGLLCAIGTDLVFHKKVLAGCEIRFLRKQLDLSQEGLAAQLGTSDQTVARWEKEEARINVAADALLRLFFIENAGLLSMLPESQGKRIRAFLGEIRSRHDASGRSKRFYAPDGKGGWKAKAA